MTLNYYWLDTTILATNANFEEVERVIRKIKNKFPSNYNDGDILELLLFEEFNCFLIDSLGDIKVTSF